MSRFEKIIEHLLNPNTVLTLQELDYLLGKMGYDKKKMGKTSGSRIAYVHQESKHIIRIHKPHPGNEIKKYVKLYIIDELNKNNLL